jgi:hypothetical protein
MGDGSSMRHEADDFIIAVSAYLVHGVAVEPADGDIVITNIGGTLRRYELRPFAGEASARPLDQSRRMWRCHTKFIGTGSGIEQVDLTENQLRAIIRVLPIVGDEWSEDELRHALGIPSLAA